MRGSFHAAGALLLLASTGSACNRAQPTPEIDPLCGEGGQRVAALTERTALGFSAQDVLSWAQAERAESLSVRCADEQVPCELEDARVSFAIAARADPVCVKPDCERVPPGVSHCPPSLFLPVRVSVKTDRGGLDETFDAELRADAADSAEARLYKDVPLSRVPQRGLPQGSTKAMYTGRLEVHPKASLGQLALISEATSGGGVTGHVELDFRWPAESASATPSTGSENNPNPVR